MNVAQLKLPLDHPAHQPRHRFLRSYERGSIEAIVPRVVRSHLDFFPCLDERGSIQSTASWQSSASRTARGFPRLNERGSIEANYSRSVAFPSVAVSTFE